MSYAKEISISKINSGAKNIEHHIYNVSSRNKYEALKRIADFNPNIYGIVFCRTKRHTKDIANKFIAEGYMQMLFTEIYLKIKEMRSCKDLEISHCKF